MLYKIFCCSPISVQQRHAQVSDGFGFDVYARRSLQVCGGLPVGCVDNSEAG